ncbi:MAG: hypothetical protein DRI71_10085 [Bacteroidetes bacterium]|nr:MAG: hypothetical protein DRI71_10085 [Bacteroidota bacterium]
MNLDLNHKSPSNYFAGSATYQISVKGKLDANWSDRLAGMSISLFESDDEVISTLTGKIIDQAELFGVLNALNNYQYKVLSVNQINKF